MAHRPLSAVLGTAKGWGQPGPIACLTAIWVCWTACTALCDSKTVVAWLIVAFQVPYSVPDGKGMLRRVHRRSDRSAAALESYETGLQDAEQGVGQRKPDR
jgi:hypothetical protein